MADETVVKEAQTMGWVPREQFRGAEEKWVDADVFELDQGHVLHALAMSQPE